MGFFSSEESTRRLWRSQTVCGGQLSFRYRELKPLVFSSSWWSVEAFASRSGATGIGTSRKNFSQKEGDAVGSGKLLAPVD